MRQITLVVSGATMVVAVFCAEAMIAEGLCDDFEEVWWFGHDGTF